MVDADADMGTSRKRRSIRNYGIASFIGISAGSVFTLVVRAGLTISVVAGITAGIVSGILGGFIHQLIWASYSKDMKCKTYLRSLWRELHQCKEALKPKQGNQLTILIWTSTVNGGFLDIFAEGIVQHLTQIYGELSIHNYEAEKCWEIGKDIDAEFVPTPELSARRERLLRELGKREESLLEQLEELLEQPWWRSIR